MTPRWLTYNWLVTLLLRCGGYKSEDTSETDVATHKNLRIIQLSTPQPLPYASKRKVDNTNVAPREKEEEE